MRSWQSGAESVRPRVQRKSDGRSGRRLRFVLTAMVIGALCSLPRPGSGQELQWDRLAEGLDVTLWSPGARCHEKVPPLLMVKVDPERLRFSTYHFRDEGLAAPLTIQEWQRRTRADVVFNAGLFREDYSYLGLLLKDGRSLGKRHPRWQGLFVAEPVEQGLRKARVLDLSVETFVEDRPMYREAAQSLMLLDQQRKLRVRQTGKQAHQTVVGENRDGQIVVIKTADVVALFELAECLRDGLPGLTRAMAMDGGTSSDLFIGAEVLANRRDLSERLPWRPLVEGSATRHIPLPSVIGVLPRRGG